jgi:hypothetical protein
MLMRVSRFAGPILPFLAFLPLSSIYPTSTIGADNIAGVMEDAKFKRREALADLAKAASKK